VAKLHKKSNQIVNVFSDELVTEQLCNDVPAPRAMCQVPQLTALRDRLNKKVKLRFAEKRKDVPFAHGFLVEVAVVRYPCLGLSNF